MPDGNQDDDPLVQQSMRRTLTSLTLVAVLALAGCGDDDTDTTDATAAGAGAPLPAATCIGDQDELRDEYLGLSEAEALDLAADQGLTPREVGRDGECAAITMDLRDDRVNLEYVDDVVVGAAIF